MHCETEFQPSRTGPRPRYCGPGCKVAAKLGRERQRGDYLALTTARKRKTAQASPPCLACGGPTPTKRSRYCKQDRCRTAWRRERADYNRRYAVAKRADLYAKGADRRHHPDRTYTCTMCGATYERTEDWLRIKYCSTACVRAQKEARRATLQRRSGAVPFRHLPSGDARRWAECRYCGEAFLKTHPAQVFCCHLCRNSYASALRSKRTQGAWVEHVDRLEVFDRDRWTCHLCGDPLKRGAKVPDLLAPTIDHLTPLTKGGEHSMLNVASAHFSCNSRKGNRFTTLILPPAA